MLLWIKNGVWFGAGRYGYANVLGEGCSWHDSKYGNGYGYVDEDDVCQVSE